MSNPEKRIVILTEDELRKTLSRLTSEIIEKVSNIDNLLLIGIPTRGVNITEVMGKEILNKTGVNLKKGTTFIFATHDDMILKEAKRVISIKDGVVVRDEEK